MKKIKPTSATGIRCLVVEHTHQKKKKQSPMKLIKTFSTGKLLDAVQQSEMTTMRKEKGFGVSHDDLVAN